MRRSSQSSGSSELANKSSIIIYLKMLPLKNFAFKLVGELEVHPWTSTSTTWFLMSLKPAKVMLMAMALLTFGKRSLICPQMMTDQSIQTMAPMAIRMEMD